MEEQRVQSIRPPQWNQQALHQASAAATQQILPEAGMSQEEMSRTLEELRSRARIQIDEAVGMLAMEKKQAYLEARACAPDICETESHPLKFLRRCDYNAWNAAERLCLYWKERKELFGNRAHLPLTITGDGALTADDVFSVQAGLPAILPPTTSGQPVLFIDRRQAIPGASVETKLRSLFYIVNILSNNELAQTEGVLALLLAVTPRHHPPDFALAKRVGPLVANAFPIKIVHHHCNRPPPAEKHRYLVQDMVTSSVSIILEYFGENHQLNVHFERNEGDIFRELTDLGLTPEGIPASLGGTWTFLSVTQWCRAQVRREEQQHAQTLMATRQPRERQNSASGAESAPLVAAAAAAAEPESSGTGANEGSKKGRNVIYSRRNRDRRRLELNSLRSEHASLVSENRSLIAEEARLTRLVEEAQRLAAEQEAKRAPTGTP